MEYVAGVTFVPLVDRRQAGGIGGLNPKGLILTNAFDNSTDVTDDRIGGTNYHKDAQLLPLVVKMAVDVTAAINWVRSAKPSDATEAASAAAKPSVAKPKSKTSNAAKPSAAKPKSKTSNAAKPSAAKPSAAKPKSKTSKLTSGDLKAPPLYAATVDDSASSSNDESQGSCSGRSSHPWKGSCLDWLTRDSANSNASVKLDRVNEVCGTPEGHLASRVLKRVKIPLGYLGICDVPVKCGWVLGPSDQGPVGGGGAASSARSATESSPSRTSPRRMAAAASSSTAQQEPVPALQNKDKLETLSKQSVVAAVKQTIAKGLEASSWSVVQQVASSHDIDDIGSYYKTGKSQSFSDVFNNAKEEEGETFESFVLHFADKERVSFDLGRMVMAVTSNKAERLLWSCLSVRLSFSPADAMGSSANATDATGSSANATDTGLQLELLCSQCGKRSNCKKFATVTLSGDGADDKHAAIAELFVGVVRRASTHAMCFCPCVSPKTLGGLLRHCGEQEGTIEPACRRARIDEDTASLLLSSLSHFLDSVALEALKWRNGIVAATCNAIDEDTNRLLGPGTSESGGPSSPAPVQARRSKRGPSSPAPDQARRSKRKSDATASATNASAAAAARSARARKKRKKAPSDPVEDEMADSVDVANKLTEQITHVMKVSKARLTYNPQARDDMEEELAKEPSGTALWYFKDAKWQKPIFVALCTPETGDQEVFTLKEEFVRDDLFKSHLDLSKVPANQWIEISDGLKEALKLKDVDTEGHKREAVKMYVAHGTKCKAEQVLVVTFRNGEELFFPKSAFEEWLQDGDGLANKQHQNTSLTTAFSKIVNDFAASQTKANKAIEKADEAVEKAKEAVAKVESARRRARRAAKRQRFDRAREMARNGLGEAKAKSEKAKAALENVVSKEDATAEVYPFANGKKFHVVKSLSLMKEATLYKLVNGHGSFQYVREEDLGRYIDVNDTGGIGKAYVEELIESNVNEKMNVTPGARSRPALAGSLAAEKQSSGLDGSRAGSNGPDLFVSFPCEERKCGVASIVNGLYVAGDHEVAQRLRDGVLHASADALRSRVGQGRSGTGDSRGTSGKSEYELAIGLLPQYGYDAVKLKGDYQALKPSRMPKLLRLILKDGYSNHVIATVGNQILDSTVGHAMDLTAENLRHCCGGTPLSRVEGYALYPRPSTLEKLNKRRPPNHSFVAHKKEEHRNL